MLAFNNKILTISNKGLEYTPPSPPPPPPEPTELLYECGAVSFNNPSGNYISLPTIGTNVWQETSHNYIALKMTMKIIQTWTGYPGGCGIYGYGGSTPQQIIIESVWSGATYGMDGDGVRYPGSTPYSLGAYTMVGNPYGGQSASTVVVESDGRLAGIHYLSEYQLTYDYVEIYPIQTTQQVEPTFYGKLILDKANNTITCYVNGKKVCTVAPTEVSLATTQFFGMGRGTVAVQIYGCDTFADAEGV